MGSPVDTLIQQGCVKLGPLLERREIVELQLESAKLLDLPKTPFNEYQTHKHERAYRTRVYTNDDWTVAVDILGQSQRFDELIGKLLVHPALRSTMEAVLGPGYKMWQLNIRRHESGSRGQPLHQDEPGGLGISILVSETPSFGGATVFLPRSHRWPIKYSDIGVTLRPEKLTGLLTGATGGPGDVSLFFHRTWHGRYPGDSQATAILMSFFCVGSTYPLHEPSPALLETLSPELQRLLDPRRGIERLEGNNVRVVPEGGGLRTPPAIDDLRYALHGPAPANALSPWRIVQGIAQTREAVVRKLGRERLRRLRDALSTNRTHP